MFKRTSFFLGSRLRETCFIITIIIIIIAIIINIMIRGPFLKQLQLEARVLAIQRNLYSRDIKGHLHSGATKFGPGKIVIVTFRRKGHYFWALKPGFNIHSGDTLALKR